MKRYLVTGGAGFIGSHIVEALVKKGERVRVLDNFYTGKKENLKAVIRKIDLFEGDIRHKKACIDATEGIDIVLHQAALRSVPKSLDNPKSYNEVNIQGTLNMLEASLRNRIKCFVFASSSSVYGEAERFPQKEDDPPRLISPYALTKLAGEYYCRIFYKTYGLNTVCLRYFNVFGPRQAVDDQYAVVIPKFIICLLGSRPCPIYGSGRQSRDFTYIDNVVLANLLAAAKTDLKGDVFNIASSRDHSILELNKILNSLFGKNIKPVFLPLRKGDVFKTHADISRARKILGFSPKIDFTQGLIKTAEWFKNR